MEKLHVGTFDHCAMQNQGILRCKYCGKSNFSAQRYLTQHQSHGFCAQRMAQEENGGYWSPPSPMSVESDHEDPVPHFQDDADMTPPSIPSPPRKNTGILWQEFQGIDSHDIDGVTRQMYAYLEEEDGAEDDENEEETDHDSGGRPPKFVDFGTNSDLQDGYSSSTSEGTAKVEETRADSDDSGASGDVNGGPDTTIRDQFREYVAYAKQHFTNFSAQEVLTIRLLHLMKDKHTPNNAFEPLMLWHLQASNKLREHQTLKDYPQFIGRKTMIKRLINRYNFENKMPAQKVVKLPVSGTIVKVTCHDTKASIQRLLTDPRINPKDYLFWDGIPTNPPPENLDYIKDLNTGQAYLQTHAILITKEGQQLLPIIIYTDGTAVSHFHNMEIIQVKIALGIFTREARIQPHCWVPLGYIEKVHEQGGRGRAILEEANHLETQDQPESDMDSEVEILVTEGVGDKNDQDFHAMMAVILEDLVELQEHGLLWDHHDQVTGIRYQDVHYLPFVPFLRVDGKEADLCCAKYSQRSSAQQICRKCHIPLQNADDHMARYRLKTVDEIKKLIDRADLPGLQKLSQTYLRNAFYGVRFSLGNKQGIHGACPSELLHAFLLGTFKYLRDIFFEFIGSTSEGARLINALAKIYGKLFSRQSDRTMPGTAFSKGIQQGKLMAKDYRGVLLIMLAIVRSTKGRNILKKNKIFKDAEETALDDWILLIELMLEWESYLNEPLMYVKHVKRLERKHRYIMYVMRKVAQRTKGMGLKLLKFHTILHIWEDIIQFGVPLEYDTSANESMHKPAKQASKLTQRAADTFNFQTAQRLCEFDLLDLAIEEIENGRRLWDYFSTFGPDSDSDTETQTQKPKSSTGETQIKVFWDKKKRPGFELLTRSGNKDRTQWNTDLLHFLLGLQDLIQTWDGNNSLQIFTCHRRDGQIFRGHPNYRGKGSWRDWVWVDWGPGYGRLPCHIWCFIVLDGCPSGRNRAEYGGIPLSDGTYAVVESTSLEDRNEEVGKSDLMLPVLKDVTLDEKKKEVVGRHFYLADTEAFADPCCTIPDIGGPPNRYFVVKPRSQWPKLFVAWIQDEHNLDVMDKLEVVPNNPKKKGGKAQEEKTKAAPTGNHSDSSANSS